MKTTKNPHKISRSSWLQNVLLSIGSIAIFFSLGEVITRLAVGSPLITQPDEVLFWKYKEKQSGHQKLYSPISRVDNNGFRYSGKEFDPSLPSIYVGGDSYTWGEGVLDEETITGQLQQVLGLHNLEYNVLNGGVPGYGIEQIIDRMQIESKRHNPRYAIFLWVEADINRLREVSLEKKKKFLRDYRLRSMFRYSAFLKFIKEQVFDKLLRIDVGFGYNRDRNIEYAATHSFDQMVQGLTPKIKENVDFLKNRKIVPIWAFMTAPSSEFRQYLHSLSKELSVILIDPEPSYRKHFPGLKKMATKNSGHFKPKVYGLLAAEIFARVLQLKGQ